MHTLSLPTSPGSHSPLFDFSQKVLGVLDLPCEEHELETDFLHLLNALKSLPKGYHHYTKSMIIDRSVMLSAWKKVLSLPEILPFSKRFFSHFSPELMEILSVRLYDGFGFPSALGVIDDDEISRTHELELDDGCVYDLAHNDSKIPFEYLVNQDERFQLPTTLGISIFGEDLDSYDEKKLDNFWGHFSHIQELTYSISDPQIFTLIPNYLPLLQSLELKNNRLQMFPEASLKQVIKGLPLLKQIGFFRKFSYQQIQALLPELQRVESLSLGHFGTDFEQQEIQEILTNLPHLKRLTLTQSHLLQWMDTYESLEGILPSLKSLQLYRLPLPTGKTKFTQSLTHLEHLRFVCYGHGTYVRYLLPDLHKLTSLELEGIDIFPDLTPKEIQSFHLASVMYLRMKTSLNVDPRILDAWFSRLTNLKELDLSEVDFTKVSKSALSVLVNHLKRVPKLKLSTQSKIVLGEYFPDLLTQSL